MCLRPVPPRWFLALCLAAVGSVAHAWNSKLVPVDRNGRLSYAADPTVGGTIPDFSHAGYRGGGVPLPDSVPIVKTLAPAPGDNTARIQAALDELATLPVQPDGYRGALKLQAGTWEVVGTIRITVSGIVLSGSGDGDDPTTNTILRRTGTSQAAVIQAGNRDDQFKSEVAGTRSEITTARVAVGARAFEVDHPERYGYGDAVVILHPSTQTWLDAVDRGGVTDSNYWRPGEIDIRYHRYVTDIIGNTVLVDAPVFTKLDRALSQSVLYRYDASHIVRRIGLERLQVDVVTRGELTEDHAEDAIKFVGTEDSWIRDCTMKHFWHAGVQFEGSTRGTVERCRAVEPHGPIDGGYRYNFSTYHAQLILFRDCFTSYARHAFVCNGTSLDSGIVFLNGTIDHAYTSSEGHRRWSTGILYDNITATSRLGTDVLGLYNRGTYGTGHGWAAAHSVAWNCNAGGGRIWIQRPPTAQNYGIGCSGNVTGTGPFAGPAGYIEGTGQSGLEPKSLYLAQLAQRLADAGPPVITSQPGSHVIANGETVLLRFGTANAQAFQWLHDGAAIPGATGETLVFTATASSGGMYQQKATNAAGAVTSSEMPVTIVASTAASRLSNVSIRARTGSGAETLIVGFIVQPGGSGGGLPVLLRVAGPALARFGVGDALPDPRLALLVGEDVVVASNDDWAGDASVRAAAARVGAFAFSSDASFDAALVPSSLSSGGFTMWATASPKAPGAAGVVLAEVYDATGTPTAGAPRLANVSARTLSGNDGAVLIAGFAITGTTSKTVLIRGVGPTLGPFGVTGALADPRLDLYNGANVLASNDDWGGIAAVARAQELTGAFRLPTNSRDAALLVTLLPGTYTAHVSGAAGATGVALVEVYALTP